MSISTFAAIHVGSYEVMMKLYEISKKNGLKEIDCVCHTLELGTQTYNFSSIDHSTINELCNILLQFNDKMKEYEVTNYSAYATSGLREAKNNILILDQIKLKTGLQIKILSNSEQRFLCYKALPLKEPSFSTIISKGTAIVDVGAGSIQISLYSKNALLSTQNIKLGSLRLRELLFHLEQQTTNYSNLISEIIDNDLNTYQTLFLKDACIENIIAFGDQLKDFVRLTGLMNYSKAISRENFHLFNDMIHEMSLQELSKKLKISKEQASLLLPTSLIYEKMFQKSNAKKIYISNVCLCDGIAVEYANQIGKLTFQHKFIDDIIQEARNLALKYHCDTKHSTNVEYIALTLFDNLKKIHGLGKRERLYLQIACILHNCGEFINMNQVRQHSYHIVLATEIIGLSHWERELIANIVRYDTKDFPIYSSLINSIEKDTYIILGKLVAILRLSNTLDKSHKQKIKNINIRIKKNIVELSTNTLEDLTLEKGLFFEKADFFQEVFGLNPIIKQKRSL